MKVFVVGSVNMDLVIHAGRMPRGGETIHGAGFVTNPGGKGANQAVALAKMGADVSMVGGVGDAFGEELIRTLAGYGVNTDYVRRYPDVSSGIAVIVVADGDNRIILDSGANGKVDRALVDEAFRKAAPGDYLVVQLEIGMDTVRYAMARAKELGMVTVLNPAPAAELPADIFENCDFFMPNQTEAAYYTGIYPVDEQSARRCAAELGQKGVRNVVITMGEEGSAGIFGDRFVKISAARVKAVDTTAAGDTYVGAFVSALSEGAPMEQAMQFAGAAASISVTRSGAQRSIPYRVEVKTQNG